MAEVEAEGALRRGMRTAEAASRKLVFIGFMGAGKSTAAAQAAEHLGGEAVDTDTLLEAQLGEPIASFFERHGESAFREREQALVLDLLERPDPTVVALGGGAVESKTVREKLGDHLCVYLEVEPERAWERSQGPKRPLARDRDSFLRLYAQRLPLYESVARAILPLAEGAPSAPALDAVLAFGRAGVAPSVRIVWAETEAGGYPVYAGEGAIDAAGALWPCGGRSFVVTDEQVGGLYGERLRAALSGAVAVTHTVTVPAGEPHKTLAEFERVQRELARAGMERSDTLIALGGGVVGDLAGFCAATYQRGVALVQIPTTVVGQVDSAYGGKTGIDLPEAKNYVGAFYQPKAVLTDPSVLLTLPEEELRSGFAEMVKTALIAGGRLWSRVRELGRLAETLAGDIEAIGRVIEGCLRAKLAVVAVDERDAGARAALNLGHTVAHALEAATGYTVYSHGEAVGLGLLAALRLSERSLGLDPAVREQVAGLLERQGLPLTFTDPSTDDLLERAALDKKRRSGRQNLVLLRAPGDVVTHCEVPPEALREAIEELRDGGEEKSR